MPAPRPPARLPNARRRRPDTRRSQFEQSPENQLALILAVRVVAPDSLEVEFDRPLTCYSTTDGNLQGDSTTGATSEEWTQTSPRTWQVQMSDTCTVGHLWSFDATPPMNFSPAIQAEQQGTLLAN